MAHSKSRLTVALAVLLAAVSALAIWQWSSQRRAGNETSARLDAALRRQSEAAARAAALEQENAALRAHLIEQGIDPPEEKAASLKTPGGDAKRLEAMRELTQTQARLAAALAAVSDWQFRVHELEGALEKAVAENKRLSAEDAGLREDLDSARRLVAATDGELKTKSARLAQLEADNRRARADVAAAAQRSTQAAELANELFDINRRRETVVNSLQRRYRDMTDLLRALALRLDTQRDTVATAAPDVSRMQSTAQAAEDDMRQLASLNTQAQRIAQKLSQK